MSDYGKAIARDTVRIERLLPGPIERVWAYLTESEKRGKWLAAGELEPRVGGKVQLNFLHATLTPHQEPIPDRYKDMECGHGFEGTVTFFDPPHVLGYTWGCSEVKFELTPRDNKVLLVITHTRLSDPGEMACVSSGWHAHLGILEDNLAGQPVRPFWSQIEELEPHYRRQFATENE